MHRALRVASLIAVLAMPGTALAWNDKGHMVVAYIAYQQLTPPEQAAVFRTLASHPDFPRISALAGSPQGAGYRLLVFLHAARWPDRIRDDPRFYDETDPHAQPTKKLKDFPDMKKHKPWHFKDEGFSPDGTGFAAPDHVNAKTAINAFRGALGAAGLDAPRKAYFLVWLEHLVGDVHQPLHCAARFTRAHPRGDRGGNLLDITPFAIPGVLFAPNNLHSLWDDVLGGETALTAVSVTAHEAALSSPPEAADDLDTAAWIRESFEYAKSAAYAPLAAQTGPAQITAAYFADARALALRRVKLAGHRLAALIKASLAVGSPAPSR